MYLDGYVNIDLQSPKTFLAQDRPDLVEKWKTTEDKYYARHQDKNQDTLRAGPLDQEYVCDCYGSFDNPPAAYWSVSEVLTRHCFEHLSITEAHKALDAIDAIMEPNGILRIDVPDHEGTLRKFKETGDEFYIRHLLGPRRNQYGYHMMSYSRERLTEVVEEHGFLLEREEENPHFFPAFTLRFRKPGPRSPREYVTLPDIPAHWRVLDVGPGEYPHPRANVFLDRDASNVRRLEKQGKKCINADLMSGLPEVGSKTFDYIWSSHVLEHVDDVQKVAATLSRIGKRGTVVLPSAMKEGLFSHEETDHKWLILPSSCPCGPPVFVRHNPEYIGKARDIEMQKIMSRLLRTGPNRLEEGRYLRKWFYRNEESLDIVYHWENELKVQVVA